MHTRHVIHHIPVCPFSQRLEILLELKGARGEVDFRVVDITQPRPQWLLQRMRGSTALPMMETPEGVVLKESLILLDYLDEVMPGPRIARASPLERAVERMLIAKEGRFAATGYGYLMNREPAKAGQLHAQHLDCYAQMDEFLREHNPDGVWLFEEFGMAEAVFTPLFMRFWFLEYYEDFALPEEPRFERVRRWRDACLAHCAVQQVTREEIVKLYYDYAQGVGNGGLAPGRGRSSFAMEPDWRSRPWPPRDKFRPTTDAELGLL